MTDPNPTSEAASARANTFPWPPVLLIATLAGAVIANRIMPIGWPGVDDAPARAVGMAIGLAGLGLIIIGIVALRRHETTVMPDKAATTLVTSGPYRFFRNPIYLGEVMAMFGLAEMTKNIWFVMFGAAFAILVTILQIVPEERHLEARFGELYLDYKTRARRWI